MNRMSLEKRYKQFIFVIIIVIFFIIFYMRNVYESKHFDEWKIFRLSLNGKNECYLPLGANPFDESVNPYLVMLENRIDCHLESSEHNYYSIGPNEESLTFVDNSGVLITIGTNVEIRCVYQNFSRIDANDDKLQYSSEQQLPQRLDLKALNIEFVFVKCFDGNNLVYTNTHFFPSRLNKRESEPNKPSVIILVIESLSRLNYLRFMNQTRHAFESLGNYFYLKGLTKHGDNSFPNMATLLTGLRTNKNEFPANVNETGGPYDELPLIWKPFAKMNYKTAFIEDHPEFTLFNYEKKGFTKVPTDWYPRPFWLHIYQDAITKKGTYYCYKNQPKVELLLKQVKQFLDETKSKSVFVYAFLIQVTHDDFNKVQLVDSHFAEFINGYKTYLNDSIFILMGDHGNRYGEYLQTLLGRIEERMPLFALHLPQAMLANRPHLKKYLDINSQRLTTWLDVHQMLLDISESNYNEVRSVQRKRQYSFWREEIPVDRTCEEALIPEVYCVCDERIEVKVSESFVIDAGHSLIAHVNNLLSSKTQKCAPLILDHIKGAWAVFSNSVIQKNREPERKIEVILSAKPSNAIFNGLLYQNKLTSDWIVRGDVSRLNKYGNQSSCIDDEVLKKYCFCERDHRF